MWFAVIVLSTLISATVRAELRDPNNSADYIILTSQEVLANNSWIDSLLEYRAAQGRVSMAVTVEEIWAEFTPSGSDTAIREFLHYAYDDWQAPQLKDVFIVGHWDVVPSHLMQSVGTPDEQYLSDFFYTTAEPESATVPLFRIGRLPWSPAFSEPLPEFRNKIQSYEALQLGQCEQTIQLIADMNDGTFDFEQITDHIATFFPNQSDIERDYIGRLPGDPAYGDHAEILANLSAGPFSVFVIGHCGIQTWFGSNSIVINDIATLSNAPCFSIYSGNTHHDMLADTVAITNMSAAVLNMSGGAIACYANTGNSWAIAGKNFEYSLAQSMSNEANESSGAIWSECISDYLSVENVYPGTSVYETVFANILFGDPATIIPGRTTSADPIMAPPIPKSIEIVGNYPNPFNPSTAINFMLNRAGLASLTVYDITGRAVTTLAQQNFTAGEHSIVWNAAGQASGMYLVRLESAGQFATHRVTLLK